MDLVDSEQLHRLECVSRLAVMGFTRGTCARGGSAAKDWFDRAGLLAYWATRNVLSVGDLMWSREGMELVLPDGSHETDPLRSEVHFHRVKHHLFEAGYKYDMSVTADAVQVARRANTWLWTYQMARGLLLRM